MSFIAKNPLSVVEASSTPPAPLAGTKGFFPKSDGWYSIDSDGVEKKILDSDDKIDNDFIITGTATITDGYNGIYGIEFSDVSATFEEIKAAYDEGKTIKFNGLLNEANGIAYMTEIDEHAAVFSMVNQMQYQIIIFCNSGGWNGYVVPLSIETISESDMDSLTGNRICKVQDFNLSLLIQNEEMTFMNGVTTITELQMLITASTIKKRKKVNDGDWTDWEEIGSGSGTSGDVSVEKEALERLQYYGDANIVPSDENLFTILNGAISLNNEAKQDTTLTNIVIPYKIGDEMVTSIGNLAFQGCSGLTSITIPNSVTSISNAAFSKCTGLTSITIPDRVVTIDGSVFAYCSGITSITIPDSVTYIGTGAFAYCLELTSITIADSVTRIDSSAFVYCSEDLTIICSQGSTADTYAKENGIKVMYDVVDPDSLSGNTENEYIVNITVVESLDGHMYSATADKTYNEVLEAFNNGKNIYAVGSFDIYSLKLPLNLYESSNGGFLLFGGITGTLGFTTVVMESNGSIYVRETPTNLDLYEKIANKTSIVSEYSTDEQYPSAKAVWDVTKNAGGAVSSVNGKTGDVELTAEDVGAYQKTEVDSTTDFIYEDINAIKDMITEANNSLNGKVDKIDNMGLVRVGVSEESRSYYIAMQSCSSSESTVVNVYSQEAIDKEFKRVPTLITDIEDNALILTHNQEARLGEIASLTLSMPSTIDDLYWSSFCFASPASGATSISYSGEPIIWCGDDCDSDGSFVPEADTKYEISIKRLGDDIVARVGAY